MSTEDVGDQRAILQNLLYWARWRDADAERRDRSDAPVEPNCLSETFKKEVEPRLKYLATLAFSRSGLAIGSGPSSECDMAGKSLHSFFLAMALRMEPSQKKYWASGAASETESANALANVALVAHHLFADFPLDQQTLQAMSWLLFEYVHRGLGVPERLDVAHHLAQAARTEPSLHMLRQHYRDHFFHALEVCFFGHFLLELRVSETEQLWHVVARKLGTPDKKKHVLRLWYVASLLHDVGYGVEVLKGVKQLLEFFQNADPLKKFTANLTRAVKNLSKKLAKEPILNVTADDKPGEDHGIVAAHHLRSLLKSIEKDDPELKAEEYEPAIRAIALHNYREKEKVAFSKDPLAVLLILCDTVQEWNRPRLNYHTAPYEFLSWMHETKLDKDLLDGPLQAVCLNVDREVDNNQRFRMADEHLLHIRMKFDKSINRNDQVFHMWLDASCNLQRLDLAGLPFNIKIEYVTPYWLKGDGSGREQQFHRLRDAARETHMGFLERWFPNRGDGDGGTTNGAVTYKADVPTPENDPLERVTLDLGKLAESKRITKDIGEFRKNLCRWKHYHDNLDFLGDYGLPDCPC